MHSYVSPLIFLKVLSRISLMNRNAMKFFPCLRTELSFPPTFVRPQKSAELIVGKKDIPRISGPIKSFHLEPGRKYFLFLSDTTTKFPSCCIFGCSFAVHFLAGCKFLWTGVRCNDRCVVNKAANYNSVYAVVRSSNLGAQCKNANPIRFMADSRTVFSSSLSFAQHFH